MHPSMDEAANRVVCDGREQDVEFECFRKPWQWVWKLVKALPSINGVHSKSFQTEAEIRWILF